MHLDTSTQSLGDQLSIVKIVPVGVALKVTFLSREGLEFECWINTYQLLEELRRIPTSALEDRKIDYHIREIGADTYADILEKRLAEHLPTKPIGYTKTLLYKDEIVQVTIDNIHGRRIHWIVECYGRFAALSMRDDGVIYSPHGLEPRIIELIEAKTVQYVAETMEKEHKVTQFVQQYST